MRESTGPDADSLAQAVRGEPHTAGGFMAKFYGELYAIAASSMSRERVGHTLQPTALINEAYLRLAENGGMAFNDELHFRATAAEMMRRVLIDHARNRGVAKRGGGGRRITLSGVAGPCNGLGLDLLELDEALEALDALHTRHRLVVEWCYFGGMTHEQVEELLGVSARTVRSDGAMARAWLHQYLDEKNR